MPDEAQAGQPTTGHPLHRRRFLQGAAAAGALAWTTPVLVASPASAAPAAGSPGPGGGGTCVGGPVAGATHTVVAQGAALGRPQGIFAAGNGIVYIADFDQKGGPAVSGRILKWDQNTSTLSVVIGPWTAPNPQVNPTDVAVDALGNLYYTDHHNHTIRKLPVGSPTDALWATGFDDPEYLAIDVGRGLLFVSDSTDISTTNSPTDRRVWALDLANPAARSVVAGNGDAVGEEVCPPAFGPQPATSTSFAIVYGMALYNDPVIGAILYVGDQYVSTSSPTDLSARGGVVYLVDLGTGALTRYAGICQDEPSNTNQGDGDGGPATSAHVPFPQGLATDTCGNLYILQIQGQVRRVDVKTKLISTVYNAFPIESDSNTDVAFDPTDGSVYFTSQDAQSLTRLI